MRYVAARLNARHEEIRYRAYVTDALQVVTMNTARFAGGSEMSKRFADMCYVTEVETRSGAEITAHIKSKIKALSGGE